MFLYLNFPVKLKTRKNCCVTNMQVIWNLQKDHAWCCSSLIHFKNGWNESSVTACVFYDMTGFECAHCFQFTWKTHIIKEDKVIKLNLYSNASTFSIKKKVNFVLAQTLPGSSTSSCCSRDPLLLWKRLASWCDFSEVFWCANKNCFFRTSIEKSS